MRLAENVEQHVRGAHVKLLSVDLVPRLAVIVALVAVADVSDHERMRRPLVGILDQHGRVRATQRIREQPSDFRPRIAVERAAERRLGAQLDAGGASRIERRRRIQNVELDVGGQRNSVIVLRETLEGVLVELAACPLEVEHRAHLLDRLEAGRFAARGCCVLFFKESIHLFFSEHYAPMKRVERGQWSS